jgi:hypothetical protein
MSASTSLRLALPLALLAAVALSGCGSSDDGGGGSAGGGGGQGGPLTIRTANGENEAQLVIASIEPVSSCPNVGGGVESQNGRLILLQLRGRNEGDEPVYFSNIEMDYRSADGTLVDHVDSGNANSCLPHEDRYPEWSIPPGESAGGMVLDVSSGPGTIVYDDGEGTTWEWDVDA